MVTYFMGALELLIFPAVQYFYKSSSFVKEKHVEKGGRRNERENQWLI